MKSESPSLVRLLILILVGLLVIGGTYVGCQYWAKDVVKSNQEKALELKQQLKQLDFKQVKIIAATPTTVQFRYNGEKRIVERTDLSDQANEEIERWLANLKKKANP